MSAPMDAIGVHYFEKARSMLWNFKDNFSPCKYDRYIISSKADEDQSQFLVTKICYFMHGIPESSYELTFKPDDKELKAFTDSVALIQCYYTPEQSIKAREFVDKILSLPRKDKAVLDICTVFICLRPSDKSSVSDSELLPVPIFRIFDRISEAKKDMCRFMDLEGRVYEDWPDFLGNNRLPKGTIVFPSNGHYTTRDILINDEHPHMGLQLNELPTPASSLLHTMKTVGDISTTAAVLGALAVTAIGIMPVTALGVTIGATVYGTGRSVETLVDRGRHKQSISLQDAEARGAWIGVGCSALAAASMGMTTVVARAAQAGKEVSTSVRIATNIANVSAIGGQAAGIANHGYSIYRSRQEGNDIRLFDVMQLSLSMLLLTNSVVNFRSALTIEQDVAKAVISDYEQTQLNTRKSQTGFRRMRTALEQVEPDALVRDRRAIQTIRNADNPVETFRKAFDLTRVENRLTNGKSSVTFGKDGGILVGNREIPVKTLSSLTKVQQTALINDLNLFDSGSLSDADVANKWSECHQLPNDTDTSKSYLETKKMEKSLQMTNILTQKNLTKTVHLLSFGIPIIKKIFENTDDPENIARTLKLCWTICDAFGFKSAASFFQILLMFKPYISTVKNEFTAWLNAAENPNSSTRAKIKEDVLKDFFSQVNEPDHWSEWKYASVKRSIEDFKKYEEGCNAAKQPCLNLIDYWKTMQEFLSQTKPTGFFELEENISLLPFDDTTWKAEVHVKKITTESGEEIEEKKVIYFHRKLTNKRSWSWFS